MNERIKELAKEAKEYAEWTTPQGLEWFPIFKEKFADLIIRECSDYAHKCIMEDGNEYPNKSVAYRIKEHFGVEG